MRQNLKLPNSGKNELSVPHPNANRRCLEWLTYCLQIGWPPDDLVALQKIWWEHHDDYGRLIADTQRMTKANITPAKEA